MTSAFVGAVLVPWLSAFALALLPVLGALALALLRKHGVDNAFTQAIGRAGGVAYAAMLASGKPVTDRAALAQAAIAGALYLQDRMPATMLAKGLMPADAAQIAGAELGKLLAAGPAAVAGGAPDALNAIGLSRRPA